ncbi:hypothetical protein ACXRSW_03750 [Aeromonas dhakensis]|uniref:hypothetical protein n=1 Tax=Aeromonas dhakensis TaxID=196024 RepID=UPI0020B1B540|nr:hypothetical protein [Aeromonas dhakensis]MDD9307810.1 hypothetical protein [Aeromonas hydrophila]WPS57871.1 hypothetical protein RDV79_04350 [Aeromonas dhakensis]WRT71171.1 hypothetical protein VK677_12475 [Aeromonas dhakensis]CAD7491467.1 hypothetical protein KBAD45_22300 [Aeromonas dhakensis]CAD7503829.1 hypothetical protein KBAD59_18990 [Aeromonas dhakensis]
MTTFYQENEGLPETTTASRSRGGKSYQPITTGHLDKLLDYYIYKELPIVIGVYQYTIHKNRGVNTFTTCEVICLVTGMVLPINHKYSIIANKVVHSGKLDKLAYLLGTYSPLDSELQEKINNKRKSRAKNK